MRDKRRKIPHSSYTPPCRLAFAATETVTSNSPNLDLPYLQPSQAQKHVTLNEAFRRLDILVLLKAQSASLSAPPASPADGRAWIVGSAATGEWSGEEDAIAAFQDGAWTMVAPDEGWAVFVIDTGRFLRFVPGAGWMELAIDAEAFADGTLNRIGINASADTTNRLAVASESVLFNHDGSNVQLKLNKNSASDIASVLFQQGFSGRGEIQYSPTSELIMCVSPDGSASEDAMRIDNDAVITMPKVQKLEGYWRYSLAGRR